MMAPTRPLMRIGASGNWSMASNARRTAPGAAAIISPSITSRSPSATTRSDIAAPDQFAGAGAAGTGETGAMAAGPAGGITATSGLLKKRKKLLSGDSSIRVSPLFSEAS